MAMRPGHIPRIEGSVALNPPVLLFTLILAISTGLLFGMAPALTGVTRLKDRATLIAGGLRSGVSRGQNHASYGSLATFRDPDGNTWLLQEVTTRLPGRIDSATTSFGSINDLASALRRAEAAHGEHEKRLGQRDANWPDWYATYMAAEQSGTELPT
jgi:hypothetical protein